MGSYGYAPLWVSDLPALASPKVIQAPSLAPHRSSPPTRQEKLLAEEWIILECVLSCIYKARIQQGMAQHEDCWN